MGIRSLSYRSLDVSPPQRANSFLNKDRTYILCTMHGAEFEIATGRCVDGPCRGEYLTRVPIEVQGGMVYVT